MTFRVLALSLLFGTSASAASLPIEQGFYVLDGVECRDAPNAALFEYKDGAFRYPHASQCRSAVVEHTERAYVVDEVCSALGDGTPSEPVKTTSEYKVMSRTRIVVTSLTASDREARAYRYCPAIN